METPLLPQVAPLLDLSNVAEDRRAGVWALTAPSFFPGLSINDMPAAAPVGRICSIEMGGGSLWSILSAPVLVSYSPSYGADASRTNVSLLMVVDGSIVVSQNRRVCELRVGDMCLIDERLPFHLEGHERNEIAFLRMPRRAVLSRHPYLEHRTAGLLESEDTGAILLRNTLLHTLEAAPDLREEQRGSVLSAIVHLLGAATAPQSVHLDDVSWRVRSALAYIEMNLAEGSLTADRVARAQGVSRRRLDQILRSALGVSVTAHIWNRRLEQAAADLIDPRCHGQTVSQIAFASGFEDAAHFSRAFRARFGHTPRDWRAMGLANPH
jgi:AraC-like DNA-binding protein